MEPHLHRASLTLECFKMCCLGLITVAYKYVPSYHSRQLIYIDVVLMRSPFYNFCLQPLFREAHAYARMMIPNPQQFPTMLLQNNNAIIVRQFRYWRGASCMPRGHSSLKLNHGNFLKRIRRSRTEFLNPQFRTPHLKRRITRELLASAPTTIGHVRILTIIPKVTSPGNVAVGTGRNRTSCGVQCASCYAWRVQVRYDVSCVHCWRRLSRLGG